MNEAEKTTITHPERAKPIDPRMLDLHEQIDRVRDMVALARVAAKAVHMDGSEEAAHGLMLLVPIALVFDSRDESAADLAVLAALIDAL